MPAALHPVTHLTGVEIDPVTSRIARLLQPRAKILNQDFARVDLPAHFDLAIGNPPFSDRTVRSDRALRALGLRLHDYFIVKAVRALKPGGLAAFVTSSGTMDKADGRARGTIAAAADLVGAIRLPGAASVPMPEPMSSSTSSSSASARTERWRAIKAGSIWRRCDH